MNSSKEYVVSSLPSRCVGNYATNQLAKIPVVEMIETVNEASIKESEYFRRDMFGVVISLYRQNKTKTRQ